MKSNDDLFFLVLMYQLDWKPTPEKLRCLRHGGNSPRQDKPLWNMSGSQ